MASSLWYAQAVVGQYGTTAARRVDWVTDTILCSLHTSTYTPDQDAHDFFNDTSNEVSGGGYSRQTLGTKSVNYDSATNTVSLRAANTSFSSLTATFRYALIWKDTGSTATSPLLGFVDLGAQSTSATTFTIDWDDVSGVLEAVVS
jgi:hypothetical protein